MNFLHSWVRLYQENWQEATMDYASMCRECNAWFNLRLSKVEMREMADPRMPQWRLENEEIFLETFLPCTYPEPNA